MADWFKSPFYFSVCAVFGFFIWSFSFNSELNSSNYLTASEIQQTTMSSLSSDNELPVSDAELLRQLEKSGSQWHEASAEPYVMSLQGLEDYYDLMARGTENESAHGFIQISSSEAKIDIQSVNECPAKQLTYEADLKNPTIADLVADRPLAAGVMPSSCVVHVMNDFPSKESMYSTCKNLTGEPQRGMGKPCITKNLVNATYNAFIDVTSCLEIEPRNLLPKLANESGMLINTLGGGYDAGVGQLTVSAIDQVNILFDTYMKEIESKSSTNAACSRILKHKNLLTKVPSELANRCSLIDSPNNPLVNVLYMGILNRYNMKYMLDKIDKTNAMARLEQLGLPNMDKSQLVQALALAGYNAGARTIFNIFDSYLNKRLAANKALTAKDFDFHNPESAMDIDNIVKPVTEIARKYVNSPFIKKDDPQAAIKLQRAKKLPSKIRSSYMLSFPEYLIYNQNNFEKTSTTTPETPLKDYRVMGAPGYLSFLADKDKALRQTFLDSNGDQYYCSSRKFLKLTK